MPGGRPSDRSRWYNKRAELWCKAAGWIADGGAIIDEKGAGARTLATELLSVNTKRGSERVVQIESKDDIVKRLGHSPDGAEAFTYTFGRPEPPARSAGAQVASLPRRGMVTPHSMALGRR